MRRHRIAEVGREHERVQLSTSRFFRFSVPLDPAARKSSSESSRCWRAHLPGRHVVDHWAKKRLPKIVPVLSNPSCSSDCPYSPNAPRARGHPIVTCPSPDRRWRRWPAGSSASGFWTLNASNRSASPTRHPSSFRRCSESGRGKADAARPARLFAPRVQVDDAILPDRPSPPGKNRVLA